jgi:hypothetical protein
MENAQPEPSMEEILASIRRIISEDEDDQAPAASAPKPAAVPTQTPKAETTAPLELPTASEEEPADEPQVIAEDTEMMKQNVAAAMADDSEEEILDRSTAEVASQAFRNLSQSVRVSEGPGKTLEDIVTEMLRPMVKQWLDANLPAIVEEKVEEEVQRVARRRRG